VCCLSWSASLAPLRPPAQCAGSVQQHRSPAILAPGLHLDAGLDRPSGRRPLSHSRLSGVRLGRTRGLRCFRRRCGLWRPLRAGWFRRERWRDRLPSVAISQRPDRYETGVSPWGSGPRKTTGKRLIQPLATAAIRRTITGQEWPNHHRIWQGTLDRAREPRQVTV